VQRIRSYHQALATELAKDQVVGANAMADVLALLDSLRYQHDAGGAMLRVGGLAKVSAKLPVENPEDDPDWFDQSNPWRPREILQDDRILVLDAD